MSILPPSDCPICPRLAMFREKNRHEYPSFFNDPVPSFGRLNAELLIVGLAPGLKGANQTGRPFTGDYAGIVLYNALLKYGFATGCYNPNYFISKTSPKDTLVLNNARITNGVRCVPPQNKPEPSEIKNCNQFLKNEIAAMTDLKVILSLGQISHNAVLRAFQYKQSYAKFEHGAVHTFKINSSKSITLLNSYHCSRYNINTRVLTEEMFNKIVVKAKDFTGILAQ